MPDVLHMGLQELIEFVSEEVKTESGNASETYSSVVLSVANAGAFMVQLGAPIHQIMMWVFVAGKVCEKQGWHLNEPEPTDQSPFFGED